MSVRDELEQLMRATLADEAAHRDWTYAAVRPLPMPPRPWKPGLKVRGDCSKGVQFLCWWVPGTPDPMGNGWAWYGNSQTLCLHLEHLQSPSELAVGDVVTMGPAGLDHATMVLEAGADPLLWSFGHQGTPNSYRLSADPRVHQLLRLPVALESRPTADELRAKTGWFAWVAWKLGEGGWNAYGAADPAVRPNVPTRIPATWWARYGQFLANRKKGNGPTA